MAKTIITLGREYCTGGRYIAEDVANALGIKLYDKELITMAAKNSGLSEEAVAWAIRCSFCRAVSSSSWPRKAPA